MLQPTAVPMSDKDEVLDADAPVVDDDRIKRVHEEMQKMPEITLDADPLAAGPKVMNNKKAAVRNQLNRCTQIELQLLEDRGWFQRELTREQAKYDIAYTELIANNPHVRAGRSAADREAAAKVILSDAVRRIKDLELSVEDLERLLVVVKAKYRDLRNLQSQLRDQLKICEHELGLGAKWGFKSPESPFPRSAASDADVVDDLLDAVDSDPEPVVEYQDDDEDGEGEEDSEEDSEEGDDEGDDEVSVAEAYGSPVEDVLEIEDSEDELEDVLEASSTTEEADQALDAIDTGPVEEKAQEADPGDVDVDDILNGLDFDD